MATPARGKSSPASTAGSFTIYAHGVPDVALGVCDPALDARAATYPGVMQDDSTITRPAEGGRVEFDLFGQHFDGTVERYWTETDDMGEVTWARVRFDTDRIIGGVGPARDYDDVDARLIRSAAPKAPKAPAGWGSFDADDRWPGAYEAYARREGDLQMRITPGDSQTYTAPGFCWTLDPATGSGPSMSGHAATLEDAARQAEEAAEYVTSGRYEYDNLAEWEPDTED
jgi:hypothetical protein